MLRYTAVFPRFLRIRGCEYIAPRKSFTTATLVGNTTREFVNPPGDAVCNTPDMLQFFHKTKLLLDMERVAEIEHHTALLSQCSLEQLEQRGICLSELVMTSSFIGLFGRKIVTFGRTEFAWNDNSGNLPPHSIRHGDIIGVGISGGSIESHISTGVVYSRSQTEITLVLDGISNDLETYDTCFQLVKISNDVTHKRLVGSANHMINISDGSAIVPGSELAKVCFGILQPSAFSLDIDDYNEINFWNALLNKSQKDAVVFALNQKEASIIHGPPGTGKTTTIIELIRQEVDRGNKVLACAPSNVAVDNIAEMLNECGVRIIRMGHPARVSPANLGVCFEAMVSQISESFVFQATEVEKMLRRNSRLLSGVKLKRKKATKLKSENVFLRSLKNKIDQRNKHLVYETLCDADVVLATLSGSSREGPLKVLPDDHFDVVVIDECAQALEVGCWIPLSGTTRCVLAGDHQQLAPTIMSADARSQGLGTTLMQRLLEMHPNISRMLTTQYRMNELIMKWPSHKFYDNKLEAHRSVGSHLLSHIPGVIDTADTRTPLLLIDTTGCGTQEIQCSETLSFGNPGEINLVASHVESLVQANVNPNDIAIITPYNLQVSMLTSKLADKFPELDIQTVDGFQGREKEVVILSLVRCNSDGAVGFERRINVSITRARRHLSLICDTSTVSNCAILKSLVDYMLDNADVRIASNVHQDVPLSAVD